MSTKDKIKKEISEKGIDKVKERISEMPLNPERTKHEKIIKETESEHYLARQEAREEDSFRFLAKLY